MNKDEMMKIELTLCEAFFLARLLVSQIEEKNKYIVSLGSEIASVEEMQMLNTDLEKTMRLYEKIIKEMNKAVKENEQRRNENDRSKRIRND